MFKFAHLTGQLRRILRILIIALKRSDTFVVQATPISPMVHQVINNIEEGFDIAYTLSLGDSLSTLERQTECAGCHRVIGDEELRLNVKVSYIINPSYINNDSYILYKGLQLNAELDPRFKLFSFCNSVRCIEDARHNKLIVVPDWS